MTQALANNRPSMVGLGKYKYRVDRDWLRLPAGRSLGFVSQLAVDSKGILFLLNRGDPIVQIFSSAGDLLEEWTNKPVTHGHGIYISHDDRIFIVDSDNHCIFIFDRKGNHLQTLGKIGNPSFCKPFNHPTDVAVTLHGDIYVSDGYGNSHIHHFSPDGKLIRTWGGTGSKYGEFSNPHAIWIDQQERVLVADRENHRIQFFDLDGKYLTEIKNLYLPTDICEDSQGIIYISDQTPRLSAFSSAGELIGRCRTFGAIGHGIAVDHFGNIYIADMMPNNVTRFAVSREIVPLKE
jgi:sugar lactone lactonase YvrE